MVLGVGVPLSLGGLAWSVLRGVFPRNYERILEGEQESKGFGEGKQPDVRGSHHPRGSLGQQKIDSGRYSSSLLLFR